MRIEFFLEGELKKKRRKVRLSAIISLRPRRTPDFPKGMLQIKNQPSAGSEYSFL